MTIAKTVLLASATFLLFQPLFLRDGLNAAQTCIGLTCADGAAYRLWQTASNHHAQLTSVFSIVTDPDEFDGVRVQFTAEVVSSEPSTSRRGHPYQIFTVSDLEPVSSPPRYTLRVFAFMWPSIKRGDTITVEGTYHTDYWFGGWPSENFIDAEKILRTSAPLIQPIGPPEGTGEFVRFDSLPPLE